MPASMGDRLVAGRVRAWAAPNVSFSPARRPATRMSHHHTTNSTVPCHPPTALSTSASAVARRSAASLVLALALVAGACSDSKSDKASTLRRQRVDDVGPVRQHEPRHRWFGGPQRWHRAAVGAGGQARQALRRLGRPGDVGRAVEQQGRGPAHLPRQPDPVVLRARARCRRTRRCCGRFPTDHRCAAARRSTARASSWCGTGWTGEPAVWEKDGRTWLAFGAYDKAVHFLDAKTGQRILPDFPVGDIIKGSVTIDPDGIPLLYTGGRDNYYRVLALDRPEPTELWKLWAEDVSARPSGTTTGTARVSSSTTTSSRAARTASSTSSSSTGRRAPTARSRCTPQLVFHAPGWDDELLRDIGDQDVSIENSVAISGNTVYFANSGGLVQGWDISGLKQGEHADPGVPLLDRRRHRRVGRDRQGGHALRRVGVRARATSGRSRSARS